MTRGPANPRLIDILPAVPRPGMTTSSKLTRKLDLPSRPGHAARHARPWAPLRPWEPGQPWLSEVAAVEATYTVRTHVHTLGMRCPGQRHPGPPSTPALRI